MHHPALRLYDRVYVSRVWIACGTVSLLNRTACPSLVVFARIGVSSTMANGQSGMTAISCSDVIVRAYKYTQEILGWR